MNHWIVRCLAACVSVFLLLAGCQSTNQQVVPVTGGEEAMPAHVQLVRENVLEYVISSARLADAPVSTDWQLVEVEPAEGEYYFRSGDWLMIVWSADTPLGNKRVSINNKVKNAAWWGYVEPNGHVVDTAYAR